MEVLTQNISRAGRNLTDTELLHQLTEAEDLRAGLQLPQHPAEKPFLGFNTLCLGKLPQATEEPSLLRSPSTEGRASPAEGLTVRSPRRPERAAPQTALGSQHGPYPGWATAAAAAGNT